MYKCSVSSSTLNDPNPPLPESVLFFFIVSSLLLNYLSIQIFTIFLPCPYSILTGLSKFQFEKSWMRGRVWRLPPSLFHAEVSKDTKRSLPGGYMSVPLRNKSVEVTSIPLISSFCFYVNRGFEHLSDSSFSPPRPPLSLTHLATAILDKKMCFFSKIRGGGWGAKQRHPRWFWPGLPLPLTHPSCVAKRSRDSYGGKMKTRWKQRKR